MFVIKKSGDWECDGGRWAESEGGVAGLELSARLTIDLLSLHFCDNP